MRYYLNNNWFFVTCRTINQTKYFISDFDKEIILERINDIKQKFKKSIDAYSILSNHYHLLIYLQRGSDLKKIMHHINGGSSRKIKKNNMLSIKIWDKYYNSNIFSEKQYYSCLGYILGNPFKHGLVKNINSLIYYKYCNYKDKTKNMGKETVDEIIINVKNLNWLLNLDNKPTEVGNKSKLFNSL